MNWCSRGCETRIQSRRTRIRSGPTYITTGSYLLELPTWLSAGDLVGRWRDERRFRTDGQRRIRLRSLEDRPVGSHRHTIQFNAKYSANRLSSTRRRRHPGSMIRTASSGAGSTTSSRSRTTAPWAPRPRSDLQRRRRASTRRSMARYSIAGAPTHRTARITSSRGRLRSRSIPPSYPAPSWRPSPRSPQHDAHPEDGRDEGTLMADRAGLPAVWLPDEPPDRAT
jgi:hypothetical protein